MIYYTCAIISVAIIFLHIDAVFTEKQSCFDSYSMYNGISYNVTSSSPKLGSQVLVRKLCNSTGIITNLIVYLTDLNGKSKNESKNEVENENKNDSESDGEGEDDNDNEDDVEDDFEDDAEGKDKKRETDTFKFPIIQVWRNFNSSYYNNTYSYPLCADDINNDGELANVSITNKTIAFQAGDFIGYYIPTDSAYSISYVLTKEKISYSIVTDKPLLYFNTSDHGVTTSKMLPKIQILVESFESSTASSAIKSTVPLTASKSSTTVRIASTTTAINAIPTEASTIVAASATTTALISTVSTTVAAIATATIANASTIPVKPSSDWEIGSKSSSTSVTGIVIGCVVGLVICIILIILIIILIWYKKKRVIADKGVCSTAHFNNSQPKCSTDDKGFSDHQYSSVLNAGNSCLATIKNTSTYGVINAHIHINHGTDDDSKTQVQGREPVLYSEPINSKNTVKQSSKHKSSDDYESLPRLVHNYEIIEAPYQMLQDPKEIPTPVYGNTLRGNAVSDEISTNEQIYEDPGHKKEAIYSWFEKKKFRRVKKEDIRLLHQIGSGEFGVVHLGLWSNGSTDPVQVAVKTLNSQCLESDRVKFLREAAIMGQFVHNNVVQLHGVVTEEENIMILLEYMPKGDLEEILINLGATISQETCDVKCKLLMFGSQVAAGMNYLASKQFVHRDLAARNILVSSDNVCKIADFGMARDVANDTYYITTGGKIPLKWTAPEAIYYKKYSTQSDVWSFGCVLYEIWSLGHKPFEDIEGTEYVEKITTGYRLPPPPGCPRAIYKLMIQCWHPVAKHRPLPNSVSQTLQKSNNSNLLTSPVTDDAEQSMMLGEPLSAGYQLYLDMQQTYLTNIAN